MFLSYDFRGLSAIPIRLKGYFKFSIIKHEKQNGQRGSIFISLKFNIIIYNRTIKDLVKKYYFSAFFIDKINLPYFKASKFKCI